MLRAMSRSVIEWYGLERCRSAVCFFSASTLAPCFLSFGLPREPWSELAQGMARHNSGAAFAPQSAVHDGDQRSIAMVAFGLLIQATFSFLGAKWFGRPAQPVGGTA